MGRMDLLQNVVSATGQVEGYCIVKSVQQKTNAKGAEYLDFVLGDAGGDVDAKLWDYQKDAHGVYTPGSVIKVRATINVWKEAEQLKIDKIRNLKPGEEVDLGALVPCAPVAPEQMYGELIACVQDFQSEALRKLTLHLLEKNKAQMLKCPAALKLHHAMRGGLLYHTSTMLQAAQGVCDVYKGLYPALSRELVYAGVILHDVAKCDELSVGPLGLATGYSTAGQLVGHISMGASMVEAAAAELGTDEQTKLLVQHLLLSHHGLPEYGSPRGPMFPEAEIVSELDVLDSRLFEMYDAVEAVPAGEFSERQWALDNRQIYKHGYR